jgi:DNA-binding protein H-NS
LEWVGALPRDIIGAGIPQVFVMNQTLDTIASAKAKLVEELRELEEQEERLRAEETDGAFAQVTSLLHLFASHFDAKQRAQIAALVAPAEKAPRKVRSAAVDAQPKYWLPHTGETWSGRGRPPRSFTAWVGTVSHREWKAKHPKEKFPKFPG